MGERQAVYMMPIWPCVLKYARCEHQAEQFSSSTDFEILLIASLGDNMMHATFDNTIRRGVRAWGLMKLFWEGGSWEMDVVFYNINLANGCQKAAMPYATRTFSRRQLWQLPDGWH